MTSYFEIFQPFIMIYEKYFNTYIVILLILKCIFKFVVYKHFRVQIHAIFNMIISHFKEVLGENLGKKKEKWLFAIISLFIWIMSLNLFGLLAYNFPITTHISVTFLFALGSWLSVIILGVNNFNLNILSNYCPVGCPMWMTPVLIPIEIISALSRPLALGLRLAANLTAGHILLGIIANFSYILAGITSSYIFVPSLILIVMVILEICVALIQSYVFVLLIIIYLKESTELH